MMALDKLVDSAQLDGDLTSVANAIRSKGGTSAQLSFPSGMVSAIDAIPTKQAVSWNQCPQAVRNYLLAMLVLSPILPRRLPLAGIYRWRLLQGAVFLPPLLPARTSICCCWYLRRYACPCRRPPSSAHLSRFRRLPSRCFPRSSRSSPPRLRCPPPVQRIRFPSPAARSRSAVAAAPRSRAAIRRSDGQPHCSAAVFRHCLATSRPARAQSHLPCVYPRH